MTQSINEELAYIQGVVLYWAMDKNDYCSDFCLGVLFLMHILAFTTNHIFVYIHSAFTLSKLTCFLWPQIHLPLVLLPTLLHLHPTCFQKES